MEFYTQGPFPLPPRRWNYYASPEGKDLTTKLMATNMIAFGLAANGCLLDYAVFTKPKTVAHTLGRVCIVSAPVFATATFFTTATFLSTNLRGKDDYINYFVGGLSCGTIWGSVFKCGWKGTWIGMLFGAVAVGKKLCVDNKIEIFPMPKRREIGTIYRNDYTLTRDYPRNWTSDPNER